MSSSRRFVTKIAMASSSARAFSRRLASVSREGKANRVSPSRNASRS